MRCAVRISPLRRQYRIPLAASELMAADAAVLRCTNSTALDGLSFIALSPAVFVAAQNPPALAREPLARRVSAMARHVGTAFVWQRTEKLGTEKLGTYPAFHSYAHEKRGTSPISLKGATVLFPDTPPAELADLATLRRLRELGVRAIVLPHVGDRCAIVELKLRRFSAARRLLHALYLSLHGTLLGAGAWRVAGCRWESAELASLPYAENTELCERYALFEGLTQLPPIPVAHADIEWLGGGRYSVWHRHVVFSRSGERPRRLMLVPKNRWTAPFLELDARTSAPLHADEKSWLRAVEEAALAWHRERPSLNGAAGFVVLTHCLVPGGAERQWCYLAIGLKRLGHAVTFVTTHDLGGAGSHYLPLLERHGVPLVELEREEGAHPCDGNPFGSSLPRLAGLLERLRPAAVFAQLDASNILAGVAGHAAGVPRLVLSFRNYNPTHFPYIHQEWMLPCYQALAGSPRVVLTGNSQAANRDYAAWIGPQAGTVHTVPNAIDAEGTEPPSLEASAALRAALGIAEDAPVIIGVFRLSAEKRPFDFLEVCRAVRRSLPALRVLVVGEGPLREALARDLEPWIALLGRRSDVAELLHLADLLLLTSSHEGMPNAVMEAQLAGLPVVASRTGGLPDCVSDGRSALLVAPGDIDGFAHACLRLLFDPAAARAMGERGARRMREEFTIERMARRYLELVS
jgi:glycosyltransferase involved in cell wall biosynthesis